MIVNFFTMAVVTLLAEHHLNTGWLLHAMGVAGALQIIVILLTKGNKL